VPQGWKNSTTFYNQEDFRNIIEKERQRADRYGREFSCIVFKTENGNGSSVSNRKLIDVIASRVRSSDETGWYNSTDIAVLLLGSNAENAKKVALDVINRIYPSSSFPAYSVYPHTAF
jgi:hypothetical protein